MPEFTHLHLHTAYSLLDGAIRLPELFPKILAQGMKTVAVTDHGNMFGAIDFYKQAKDAGVKPIFGCETYVSATDRKDRTNRRNFHLILLARNNEGYKNLSYLNSMGFLEGFYYHPRIDKDILRQRSKGLIGLSACLGGELAQALMKHGEDKAVEVAQKWRDELGTLRKASAQASRQGLEAEFAQLAAGATQAPGGRWVVARLRSAGDTNAVRDAADKLRGALGRGAAVLALEADGKLTFLAAVTDDLVAEKKLRADELVRNVAKVTGGSGGGKPHLALAGAKDAAKLDDALAEARRLLGAALGG